MRITEIGYEEAVLAEGENEENLIERQFIGDLEVRRLIFFMGHSGTITIVSGASQRGVVITPARGS